MMQGFLLGLSSGTLCLAYCTPVLVPYILGEGQSIRQNSMILARFLSGRLLGYLLVGLLTGLFNFFIVDVSPSRGLVFGCSYMVLAALLVIYGFFDIRSICVAERSGGLLRRMSARLPFLLPLFLGFFTGLNLCPPFLLAIMSAAESGSIMGSLWFFLLFFLGTAVYFIPLPFAGAFRRVKVLKIVGKFAAGVIGVYYFYLGVIMFQGGIKLL